MNRLKRPVGQYSDSKYLKWDYQKEKGKQKNI